jgi:membrane protease YdiL (CAAX protease family)
MSSPPSSIPPPAFGVAPERPDGVERPPAPERPRWKPWTAWVALMAGLAGALMGALLIGVVATLAGASINNPTPAVNITATLVQDICLVGAAVLFASLAGPSSPRQFGLRRTRFWPALGWMLLAFVAFYFVTVVFVAIVGASPDDQKLTRDLGVDRGPVALLAVAFLVSVVAPVAEEFFFRGFFFSALRNWKGMWPAAVITGLVFGGIHVGSAEAAFLLPLAFFGFVLCLVYARTRSLYPCMALHCANNSLAFGVSQHWDWQIPVLFAGSITVIGLVALVVRAAWSPAPATAG